jgi:calcineurin-like phosphoesterase family protein
VGEQRIDLCHYAFRTWNYSHKGSWHLYGHSHGTLPEIETSLSFDVGVDSWDFYPVSFDEVAAKMATKRFEPIDRAGI